MVFRFIEKFPLAAFLLLTMFSAIGCQSRTVGHLLGRWEGRPDTAAGRAERDAERYGDTAPPTVSQLSKTDWENYDLVVSLEFVDRERIELALSDGSEPVAGEWSIISTSPIGCTIEVDTAGESPESRVRRQFQLELDERDGVCVGFTMREVGADRQLGALYFRRPSNE